MLPYCMKLYLAILFASVTSHLKFAHEWCVTSSAHEELPLKQKLNLHQVGDPFVPRWAPWWPHEPCYQGSSYFIHEMYVSVFSWAASVAIDDIVKLYRRQWGSPASIDTLVAGFMGPTWGPSGADRTQVGPMLAPWTLLSRYIICFQMIAKLNK